jgi:MoxR-like ATPase
MTEQPMTDWKVYYGDGTVDRARLDNLPPPPPWRDFDKLALDRARNFKIPPGVVEVVNAALYLRRPLLVTGDPGVGKSSLAHSIAYELDLGRVLEWSINSRSTMTEGLYQYDAIARLRDVSYERGLDQRGGNGAESAASERRRRAEDIGRYIKLGPLGTAYTSSSASPRVVLIDEIDKSDIDLPNDLLHVFENGEFEIPELTRMADELPTVQVATSEGERVGAGGGVPVVKGRIRCKVFPIVVITSNGERELPPAFLRRCLRVDIGKPDPKQLEEIAKAHLPEADVSSLADLLAQFDKRRQEGAMLATDQLLNIFFLISRGKPIAQEDRAILEPALLRDLNR